MGDTPDGLPAVPDEHLDGWTRTEATTETVFRLPTAKVVGHTVVYEDTTLRDAVHEATSGAYDRMWRFFFATRLSFSPSLPPAVGPMAVFSTVAAEANDEFVTILENRGFSEVSRQQRDRIRVDSGDRARLRRYGASIAFGDSDDLAELPVAGLLAVWSTGGEFRLAGGAAPRQSLAAFLDTDDHRLDTDPKAFQRDLLALIRATE